MGAAATHSTLAQSEQRFARLRSILFWIFLLSTLGAGTELYLTQHTEDVWQWVPLVALGIGVLTALIAGVYPRRRTLWLHRWVLLGFIVCGGLGLYRHYLGNVEWVLEGADPPPEGFELFWEAMNRKNPPGLAPAVMAQLGLLGLAYTYRHPRLRQHLAQGLIEENPS